MHVLIRVCCTCRLDKVIALGYISVPVWFVWASFFIGYGPGPQFRYYQLTESMKDQNRITEEFRVKGMICSRCLKVLNDELRQAGAEILEIELGRVVINYSSQKISRSHIERVIRENEFSLIWDKETLLAEQTKRWVINYIWNTNLEQKLSGFLVDKMQANYGSLSRNFSRVFGKTIERYSLLLKIERAKELVEYGGMNLSEIAYSLGYQNPSALSKQFKKETGMSLREYQKLGITRRIPLDKI